ncbi:MAG TPA: hypothetical protein G4O03_00795 [Dehalococcoidia bacterium]|nr:hypothetical protein [Dehalococcoidia bacterium]
MGGDIRLYRRPRLQAPVMLAAWPGIGNVSLIVSRYLQQKLAPKEMGEIEPFPYFEPTGVWVANNVVESPQFPESKFYYWKGGQGRGDLIFFIGDAQPLSKGYELAGSVLDVAQAFKVGRVYTCAAAIAPVHHSEKPKVWAVATQESLLSELKKYPVMLRGDLQIAGLNGLLLGVAKERGLEGICLLGEVPSYATRIDNPKASLSVLEVLTQMLGIDIDLTELRQAAVEAEREMKRVAAEAMSHFIDHFTMPYWERGEED